LLDKPCVYYWAKVEERRKRNSDNGAKYKWVTVVQETQTCDFFLADDSGGSVFVQGSTVKPFSIGDGAARSRSGFFGGGGSASPGLTALMERHGRGTKGFFGTNKNLRATEGAFEIGEVLACLGGVSPGQGGPTMRMEPLQCEAVTEEFMTAQSWDAFDKKSWVALTSNYQSVLMSDSAELTQSLLAPGSSTMQAPNQQQMQRVPQGGGGVMIVPAPQ